MPQDTATQAVTCLWEAKFGSDSRWHGCTVDPAHITERGAYLPAIKPTRTTRPASHVTNGMLHHSMHCLTRPPTSGCGISPIAYPNWKLTSKYKHTDQRQAQAWQRSRGPAAVAAFRQTKVDFICFSKLRCPADAAVLHRCNTSG